MYAFCVMVNVHIWSIGSSLGVFFAQYLDTWPIRHSSKPRRCSMLFLACWASIPICSSRRLLCCARDEMIGHEANHVRWRAVTERGLVRASFAQEAL